MGDLGNVDSPKQRPSPLGRHPGEPTDARVGSKEKLEVMRGRYLRGEAFFHCDDSTEAEPVDGNGRAYREPVETQSMRVARGGIRVVVGSVDDD